MSFHPLPQLHRSRSARALWLLRLPAVILGGLLLWPFVCVATHDSDSHTHGQTSVSSDHLPIAEEAVDRETPHGPHPHPGPVCVPHGVSYVLPQATRLFTNATALSSFAGVTASVTAAVAARQQAAPHADSRCRTRRSGRSTLVVVCRWRI